MHRKALIAVAVGSILGGAAYAAGEQPVAISSSGAPPAGVTGANGQPVAPQASTSGTSSTTAADEQIPRDQRAIAHDQGVDRDYRKDIRNDQAKIGEDHTDIRSDYAAERATGVNDQA
jgi:hypothetical protein